MLPASVALVLAVVALVTAGEQRVGTGGYGEHGTERRRSVDDDMMNESEHKEASNMGRAAKGPEKGPVVLASAQAPPAKGGAHRSYSTHIVKYSIGFLPALNTAAPY